jgi:ATP-dependent Clp protease ATP-binding subunit ClpC
MNDLMDDDEKMSKKQKQNSDSSTPVLDNFSRDLNKLAEQGKLDPVIGRDREILRIAQILSRRKKNNPIIIGEPGCGKTAIVEGLAMKIVSGECPRNLIDKRLVNLDLTSVVAGTKYRGQFEERMKVIIEELQANPNIIVFIDEVHTLVGSGNSAGSMDGSNIFKPALSRGEIQIIGATTLDEFRKNIEKDGALERRFQKVMVDPSSVVETIQILKNIRDKYETYHKVSYSDEVIETCVKLADRYITDREFPDKAFDIMDEVGARMQTELKVPPSIEELKKKAAEIRNQKIEVVKKQNYEQAAQLRDKEKKLLDKLDAEKKKFEEEMINNKKQISLEDVYDVVSNMTKIPVNKMSVDDTKALLNLDKELMGKVIGQDEAVKKIAKAIKRNRLGIKDPNRPIGSFVFLGICPNTKRNTLFQNWWGLLLVMLDMKKVVFLLKR